MDKYILNLLRDAASTSDGEIDIILQKAANFEGLNHKEVAALLATEKKEHLDRILNVAGQVKQHIYGKRIVLFAPLYISDYCINRCTYCGFNHHNSTKTRRKLTQEEVKKEVAVLERMGHKRLALEAGEDPENCPLDYVLDCINTIYTTSDIRRVNVNVAAMPTDSYRKLKDAEIGTYILFQETYHRETYENVHKGGPKADYDYHLTAFERAMEAGIDDVGGGVLFGLYDYKYEVLALMLHNESLEEKFGVGFHTISVPRIRDTGIKGKYPYAVSDKDFLKLVAVLRIAVPFTGMIVSTRETPEMRKKLITTGISQMSAGSNTSVGGYSGGNIDVSSGQFSLADHREANEIFYWLMEEGVLPSFCTACYRRGRSGDTFMEMAKGGDIKNICLPNGLITLKEYALDYGDDHFKSLSEALIKENLTHIENKKTRDVVEEKLALLANGERDLYI